MKQAIAILICLLVLPALVAAKTAPMVEKHIFLPEKPSEKKESVSDDKLKSNLEFTGVVISEKGKWAFIKEKRKKKGAGEQTRGYFKEGEEISGAVISSIEANRLVLINDGNEVNIKLFSGDKKRPAPVKVSKNTAPAPKATGKKNTAKNKTQSGKSTQKANNKTVGQNTGKGLIDKQIREAEAKKGTPVAPSANPFTQALKKAIDKNQAAGTGGAGASNPFIEAIKRAQQKQ